jgi:hypothetical protein
LLELSLFGFFGLAGFCPGVGTVPSPRSHDTQVRVLERTQPSTKETLKG